jgi:leucyl aminopeptidase
MQFQAIQKSATQAKCDVLVVNLFEGLKEPGGATAAVDRAVGGAITALIEREKFEGKIGQVTDLTPCGGVPAARIVIVGLGKQEDFDSDKIRRASSAAARRARDLAAKRVATILHGGGIGGIDPAAAARALVEGGLLGTYQFTKHKTSDVKPNPIEQVDIVETDGGKIDAIKVGIGLGQRVAEAVNFARDLGNEPANVVTPTYLADQAMAIAAETDIECRVIGRDEMERMGMNLLLAVSKGSRQEPKFIVMRYAAGSGRKTVALAGKGITFDSGGLNLKQGEGLDTMKDDMAGAAVVLGAMRAISALKPNVNVLGLVPATENMPGGSATHPGDVAVGLSGKSVEINNTDAEGRLIIADAVAFAEREGVDEIVDVATLTGACVVALGRGMAGIFGTDQALVDRLISAGVDAGEKLYQLPLHLEYEESLKSDVADIKNAPREAGAITGALFIKKHIEKTPWAHIDIAGPSFSDKDTPIGPKGGTGFGVGTLTNYVVQTAEL